MRFHSHMGNGYEWMSNFHSSPIVEQGLTFRSVEHLYQYARTRDADARRRILHTPSAATARSIGRNAPQRPDWEQIKVEVMRKALRLKFRQHPDLAAKLLATRGECIEHYCPWETHSFWGVGCIDGANTLGLLLEQIRDELEGV